MKYDKYKLCKRLKEIRLDRKDLYRSDSDTYNKYYCCITQEDFADALKVDRRTIIKWEKGESIPTLENLLTICDLLDCNIEYFLGADKSPYIDTIAKASHFTGIAPEIIKYATENPDYLDCLNFFMLPKNCTKLFNNVTLSAWKTYWISHELSDIKEPLRDVINSAFESFYSFTPFNELSEKKYKETLMSQLPEKKLNFSSEHVEDLINIKECLSILKYKECLSHSAYENRYDNFIDYLVNKTYEPLTNKVFIELQKEKISKIFIETRTNYLSDVYIN